MTGSAEDQAHQDLAREESRISETGNETDTAIQQAV